MQTTSLVVFVKPIFVGIGELGVSSTTLGRQQRFIGFQNHSFANQVSPNRGESVEVFPKTTRTLILQPSNAGYSGKPNITLPYFFSTGMYFVSRISLHV
jgi:hypothetical protein